MEENAYVLDVLSNLGYALNEKNDSEIIVNFPIKFEKKSKKFYIKKNYVIQVQPVGTFLTDFLNCDFMEKKDFKYFFYKYSLSIINYNKLINTFKDFSCDEKDFNVFLDKIYNSNFKRLINIQKQLDMILDYCLLNPNKYAINYCPIQRLYVLERFSPNFELLSYNKASYYSTILFSDFPGNTEKEIYEFLSNKKNKVTELNLILPKDISSIIYKSLLSILKGNVILKTCKNCNKFFIASSNSNEYCSNIAPNETKKTCRQIGRMTVFENNKNKDALIKQYYKIYNRKATMKRRNPDIQKYVDDYETFKTNGKKKLDKYKNGLLAEEKFENWLKNNK